MADDRLSSLEKSLNDLSESLQNSTDELKEKIFNEMSKVTVRFQQTASYADLKTLYEKVVPVASTFEAKGEFMFTEFEKMKQIIQNFDEALMNKASKNSQQKMHDWIERSFALKGDFSDLASEIQAKQEESEEKLTKLQEMVELKLTLVG